MRQLHKTVYIVLNMDFVLTKMYGFATGAFIHPPEPRDACFMFNARFI